MYKTSVYYGRRGVASRLPPESTTLCAALLVRPSRNCCVRECRVTTRRFYFGSDPARFNMLNTASRSIDRTAYNPKEG
jgi:hypothetical protein